MNLSTAHNTWKKCGFALACLYTLVSAADPAPDNADRAQRNAAAASRTGAAAEAALVVIEAKLPTTGQRRLRDRAAAFTVINQSAVSAPLRFKGDAVLIARMIELGYPDADAFYVPIASVGAAPLVPARSARARQACVGSWANAARRGRRARCLQGDAAANPGRLRWLMRRSVSTVSAHSCACAIDAGDAARGGFPSCD